MSFAPVDLRYGQNIINNYLATLEAQQRGRQLDLEQKKLEQEHDIETKRFGLMQAAQELQQLQEKRALGEAFSTTGVASPGTTVTSSNAPSAPANQVPTTSTGGAPVQTQNMPISRSLPGDTVIPEGYARLSHKLLGDIVVPTPEKLTEIQAGRAGAIAEAQEKPKIEGIRAQQEAEFARQLPLELYKLNFQAQKDATDRASAEKIGAGHDAARIEAARSRVNNDRTLRLLDTVSQQFNNDSITKRYQILQEAAQTANSIDDDTKDPTQHTALLNAYAKALDPSRVAAQGTINYDQSTVQSLFDSLGLKINHLTNATGALTPEAIKKIKGTVNARLKMEGILYNQNRAQSINQIRRIAPTEDPNVWIKDHTVAQAPTNKVVTTKQVQQFADENKVDFATAKKHFESFNYVVQ